MQVEDMVLAARCAEEKDVFDRMMRFFRPVFFVCFLLCAGVIVTLFPRAYSEMGMEGVFAAMAYLPVFLLVSVEAAYTFACIPAGFIWFKRLLSHLPFMIFSDGILGVAILIMLLAIPVCAGPIVFVWQWLKVRRLESKLSREGR